MKVFIETYGCTLNKSDEGIIRGLLFGPNSNFEPCDDVLDADVVIINSCSVKESTERKILHRIDLLRKKKRILVCGCMPHINKWELRARGLSMVGVRSLHRIKEALVGITEGKTVEIFDEGPKNDILRCMPGLVVAIPIAEGCVGNCTFCVTKFARGKVKSYKIKDVIRLVQQAVAQGAKEIQLTAQDVGAYGLDDGTSLRSLFHSITRLDGKFKVRVGMINPTFLDRFPREIFECDKFYRFLHVPIQSASNEVLKDMRRGYTADSVIDFIYAMRENYEFTFETDIIVGYPTEDERAFSETVKFINEIKPDITNISRFGARAGTEAAKLKQLPAHLVKERTTLLSKICRAVALEKNKSYIGRVEEVLLLEHGKSGTIKGRTNDYKQAVLSESGRIGQSVQAKIVGASQTSLFGQLV